MKTPTFDAMIRCTKRYPAVAATVFLASALASACMCLPHDFNSTSFFAFEIFVLTVVGCAAVSERASRLEARIADPAIASSWRVTVNEIDVGMIDDATLAKFDRAALLDPRAYLAQLLNLGWVAIEALNRVLVALPAAVFWLVVLAAIWSPESLAALKLSDVRAALPWSIDALEVLAIAVTGIALASGGDIGFRNCFTLRVERLVREHVRCAAQGPLVLVQPELMLHIGESQSAHSGPIRG